MQSERSLCGPLVGTSRFSCRWPVMTCLRRAIRLRAILTFLLAVFSAGCGNKTSAPSGGPSVQLTWPASATVNVTYKVYRCSNANPATAAANCVQSSPANFTAIANVALNVVTFTDSKVSSGQTYYYAATAVDSNSTESALSAVSNAVSVP